MGLPPDRAAQGILGELREIVKMSGQVWRLVPWQQRWSLGSAVLVMGITSAANTAIPLYLGKLLDSVNPELQRSLGRAEVVRSAAYFLAIIGAAYVVR
jgi:ATP-binding cassette subfamily B protein